MGRGAADLAEGEATMASLQVGSKTKKVDKAASLGRQGPPGS